MIGKRRFLEKSKKCYEKFFKFWMKLIVGILFFLISQEGVDGHPDGRRGDEAEGFLLGVPETLAMV